MQFINKVQEDLNEYLVDTGSQFLRENLINVCDKFKKIYCIEVLDDTNEKEHKLNDYSNIEISKLDCNKFIVDVVEHIHTNITFMLYSNTHTNTMLENLEHIKLHHIKTHTIIIFNIRLYTHNLHIDLNDIINKLYEINSEYKICYFDSTYSQDDILVATSSENSYQIDNPNICIHKYLLKTISIPKPPGLADFLRGTIALFYYCKKYKYKLYLDNSHPIFKYFKKSRFIINNNTLLNTIELINIYCPNNKSEYTDKCFHNIFSQLKSFSILTNSFYTKNSSGCMENFGEISHECRVFMQDILRPNETLSAHINNVFKSLNINENEEFDVIHLRCGDDYIDENPNYSVKKKYIYDILCQKIIARINSIIRNNSNKKFILLSDSDYIAKEIKTIYPNTYYMNNTKIHLGELKSDNIENGVIDALVDFFIMSKSKNIYGYHNNFNYTSGFSKIASIIYDINYIKC